MAPHLSHELLGGQDKFMVQQPAWLFLKEGRVGVNEYCLLLFHCAIATPSQPCCVVEVASSDGLRSRQERQSMGTHSQGPLALATFPLVQTSGKLERRGSTHSGLGRRQSLRLGGLPQAPDRHVLLGRYWVDSTGLKH